MSEIAIGIITYRRPVGLSRLLDSLVTELSDSEHRVIVIDNDPAQSAETICREYGGVLTLQYDIEPRRGVSHPRNKVLELASDALAVIFLDDDEWVEGGWYHRILATSRRYPEALITGPVRYALPPSRQAWADEGGHFQTQDYEHESVIRSTGSGNTLIPTSALAKLERPFFDSAYSYCGGEDHELFERLREAGCEIRWSARASVGEEVPAVRATQKWIRQRYRRSGYIRGNIMLQNRRAALVGFHGAIRVCFGVGSYVVSTRRRSGAASRASAIATLLSGLGFLSAAFRKPVVAYGIGEADS